MIIKCRITIELIVQLNFLRWVLMWLVYINCFLFVCLFVHCLIFYTAITTASANCTTGSVRLAGGPKPNTGRVEVCINKAWGTMCAVNSQWDEANANVVCSQLGFQRYGEFLICAQVKWICVWHAKQPCTLGKGIRVRKATKWCVCNYIYFIKNYVFNHFMFSQSRDGNIPFMESCQTKLGQLTYSWSPSCCLHGYCNWKRIMKEATIHSAFINSFKLFFSTLFVISHWMDTARKVLGFFSTLC